MIHTAAAVNELMDIFDALKVPYYRQGSAPEALPERFYTFWEIDQDPMVPMDDHFRATKSLFGIWYFDSDIKRLYTEPDKLLSSLIDHDWTIDMLPEDFASDVPMHARYMQVLRFK